MYVRFFSQELCALLVLLNQTCPRMSAPISDTMPVVAGWGAGFVLLLASSLTGHGAPCHRIVRASGLPDLGRVGASRTVSSQAVLRAALYMTIRMVGGTVPRHDYSLCMALIPVAGGYRTDL